MLYTSLHCSKILYGPSHVEAWAMTKGIQEITMTTLKIPQQSSKTMIIFGKTIRINLKAKLEGSKEHE